jgi:hypothetical protein
MMMIIEASDKIKLEGDKNSFNEEPINKESYYSINTNEQKIKNKGV